MLKRLIIVAKEHRQYLQAALAGAAGAAGRDIYDVVKRYLASQRVPHEDRTMKTTDVPSHQTFWHA